ncbi:hypothetical protein IMCC14465_16780 [alpha proteobacterium IMCC14465]|uniref:Uncharacterized protein n=1 Tax=alpha proteobacterium IMCC14465 TaxID=1220535 RepID=J9DEM0_9PROT|nr:hypothetical protein IMCC14465_16780 [alpha proteobacterium IMCC14465]
MYRLQSSQILIGLIGFTAFILMLWTLPSHGNYLTPRNLFMWMMIFLICGAGFLPVAITGLIKFQKVWLIGLIPPAYMLIRMVFFGSDVPESTLLTITALTGFWLLLIALIQIDISKKQWDLIFDILLVSTLIGLSVSFILPSYFNNHLSFLPASLRAPFAGFEQPNLMASFLATLVTLSFVRSLRSSAPQKIIRTIIQSAFTIIFVAVIFASQSQAGMLGLFLACLLVSLIALFFARLETTTFKKILFFWGLIIAGYGLNIALPSVQLLLETTTAVEVLNKGLAAEFSSNLNAIQGSQDLRIKCWLITIAMIADAPILGHGLGHFSEGFYNTLTSKPEFHNPPYFYASLSHPHNEILYILAEHGLIGFLLIAVPFIYMAQSMMKQAGASSLYILALLLPIGLHTMVEFPLYMSGLHWLLLGLIIIWALNFETNETLPASPISTHAFLPMLRPSIRMALIVGLTTIPAFYAGQTAVTAYQAWVHNNEYQYKSFAGYIEHSKYRRELWHPILGRRYTTLHEMVVVSEASSFGYKEIAQKLLPRLEAERHHFENYGYWVALAKGYHLLGDTENLERHLERAQKINPSHYKNLIRTLNLERPE